MRRQLFLLSLLCIFFLISFELQSKNPPGTAPISDNLYYDVSEIRNIDYREYLFWLGKHFGKDSREYLSALPDTTVWQSENNYYDPLIELYLRHPAYNNYPVVGVSYQQAVDYCNWRSDRVNEIKYFRKNNLKYDESKLPENIPVYLKYRLPTREEWELVSAADYSRKTSREMNRRRNHNNSRYNFADQLIECQTNKYHNIHLTVPVRSFWSNVYGIYDIFGNVAEMIAEEGVAKGGSWYHKLSEIDPEEDFSYHKPEKWLGFRCVCERFPDI